MSENEGASKRKSEDETDPDETLPKRVRLELQDLKDSTKEEILDRVKQLSDYVDYLEKKTKWRTSKQRTGRAFGDWRKVKATATRIDKA